MARISILLTLLLACCSDGRSDHSDWAEGTESRADGATRDYYNRAASLEWSHFMGDWRDAEGKAQGDKPYSETTISDTDKSRFEEWDVTTLVREWMRGDHRNQGFFLRPTQGGGTIVFRSREHGEKSERPQLVITTDKSTATLSPTADTYLEKSTYRSQGRSTELRVSGNPNHTLLRFDIREATRGATLRKAVLRLFTTKQYGACEIGVFRCAQGHDALSEEPKLGLAAKHAGDEGIEEDPAVLFFEDFESPTWEKGWTQVAPKMYLRTVEEDRERKFDPLQGKALRVRIAEGENTALNMLYKFKDKTGAEPEEIYFRYYLRLAPDWNQTVQGGKMPGISGTYGKAGWGGRKSRGKLGWSARGHFGRTIPEENPLGGLHPIGTYCYHADMKGNYGDVWVWKEGYRGFLKNNQWYCVEQYLKMNKPGEKDGVLRAWVDGRLAFEKTDIRFRHVPALKIEQIWMNVYHGGTIPSPHDQHLFIDHVVIAKKYIGPRKGKRE